jgi:glycosyltransferase involved in cell wall biosynthesis
MPRIAVVIPLDGSTKRENKEFSHETPDIGSNLVKLLMVTPYFYPRLGGVEKHVLRLGQEMAARGHQVNILTLQHDPSLARQEKVGELSVWRLAKREIWRARRLRWQLANEAQLIHVHDAYSLLRFYLDYRLLHPRKPFFVTFHGYEGYPIPKQALRARRLVSKLTRGSIGIGDFIPAWYGTPCDAISYGGVDLPAQVAPLPSEAGALFVGRLEQDTGILTYLDALRRLRDESDLALPLEICGEGSLGAQIESRAREQGLPVRCQGAVADFSVRLNKASMLFASGYLTMLEGMAAGRPVYALYDNPLKRDYLACFPGGALAFYGGAAELAAAIAQDYHHSEALAARVAAGLELARRSTWRAVADTYLKLYREHGLI